MRNSTKARLGFALTILTGTTVCLITGAFEPSESRESPDALEVPNVSFGNLQAQASLAQRIKIKNRSERDYTISKITTGCGCVQVDFRGPVTLPPGEVMELPIRLSGPQLQLGLQQYSLEISSADSAQRSIIREVSYRFTPPIPMDRDVVNFNSDGLQSSSREWVILYFDQSAKVQIKRIASSVDYLKCRLLDKPSDRYSAKELEIELTENAPVGESSAWVEISTDSPAIPELRVKVNCSVSRKIEVSPSTLLFWNIRSDTPTERPISIRAAHHFKILEVIPSKHASIEFANEPSDSLQKNGTARLSFTDETDGADSDGCKLIDEFVTLRVASGAEHFDLRVPLRGTVADGKDVTAGTP